MDLLGRVRTIAAVGLAFLAVQTPGVVRADGPEAGGYLGAAFPLGHYRDSVDTGGVFGAWGGYRWLLPQKGAFSLIGNPEFTLMPREDCPTGPTFVTCHSGNPAGTFSITAGPKFSVIDNGWELSLAGLGGFFQDINGPMHENGGGLAVHGTVSHEISPGFQLGAFVRFEEAFLRPAADSDRDDRQLIMAGLSFGWSPAEEAVAATVAPPPPPPPPPPPAMKRKIILRGVNFDFNKSNIRPDARVILDEAISTLKAEPGIRIRIEGYTDSIGTDAYNLRLSQRRANAVKQYFISGGIAAGRLEAVGYGESHPVATNDTADGRAQNRRAELVVIP